MTNPFVDFLNTLHNEKGSNQNAIAEMQVSSPYFERMQVKRDIIAFLREKLEAGQFVILTGHAGDGKTTLLAQVLLALGVKFTALASSADIEAPIPLHYVKDFSELKLTQQDEELRHCLNREGASTLIANTGPLLNAFKRLLGDDCEGDLLSAMDAPAGRVFSVPGRGDVFILNIARVDNIDFVRLFLDNIIARENWEICDNCRDAGSCPMLFNRRAVGAMQERVTAFIENCYTWLEEYDMRVTIRQISAHLAFAMTGGLNCRDVQLRGRPEWRYLYLFSNLFFGARGHADIKEAGQIRCISLMRKAGFDRKSTPIDYSLYVQDDVDKYYPPIISALFQQMRSLGRKIQSVNAQMVLKRAYLLFGVNDAARDQLVFKSVFSEWFETYLAIRKGKKPSSNLRDDICRAVNALFVGDSPAGADTNINLTLRRSNEQISNVQVLRGRIFSDEVELVAAPTDTVHRDNQHYHLELRYRRLRYIIRLPMLNYFSEIKNGIITTDIDPLLSNGIDDLKAQLLPATRADNDENQVTLVYMDGQNWKKRKLTVGRHSIDH